MNKSHILQVIINQYLQKIPVDKFTRLTAAWTVDRPQPSVQVGGLV